MRAAWRAARRASPVPATGSRRPRRGAPGPGALAALSAALTLVAGCRAPPVGELGEARARVELEVRAVLDALHLAAAEADEEAYFALFAPEAVFLGTDPDERWSLEAFRAYAHPHFAAGRGWTYRAVERHVELSADLEVAWFDERLENASYGECRGTGVLRRSAGSWRVAQYSLSLPVPNALARELVERIRARPGDG